MNVFVDTSLFVYAVDRLKMELDPRQARLTVEGPLPSVSGHAAVLLQVTSRPSTGSGGGRWRTSGNDSRQVALRRAEGKQRSD